MPSDLPSGGAGSGLTDLRRRERGPHEPAGSAAVVSGATELPRSIFRYVFQTSALHQLLLLALTVSIFLLEVVPLELQRRVVNDLVERQDYRLVVILCAVYAGVVVVQGATKLVLNVYRGWVGERAIRDLRGRIRVLVESPPSTSCASEAQGIEVSMIVAEVEPIGGFMGESISEPLLQGGVLLSVLAYMIHLDPWMAAAVIALFVPQLLFVPLLQSAIIRHTGARIRILRRLSISIVEPGYTEGRRSRADDARIQQVFELQMGIFRLKFTMNFLMNLFSHLQIISALLIGGWRVYADQLEIGAVVAFVSGIGRLNDPWGDLVDYFRTLSVTQMKYRLVANAVNQLARGDRLDAAEG